MTTRTQINAPAQSHGAGKQILSTMLDRIFGRERGQNAAAPVQSTAPTVAPPPPPLPVPESLIVDNQFKITMTCVSWEKVAVAVEVTDRALAKLIGQKSLQTETFVWYSQVPMDKLRILTFVIEKLRRFRETVIPGYRIGTKQTSADVMPPVKTPGETKPEPPPVTPTKAVAIKPVTSNNQPPPARKYEHPNYGTAVQTVSGVLVSMGTETVTRPGGKAGDVSTESRSYETYVVRVAEAAGEVVELQGVALAQCVAETQVQLGDTVAIHKFRQQKVLGAHSGSFGKNQFVIEILSICEDAK